MRRLILLTMLALLAVATPAHGSGLDVIRDCTDDEVMSKTYTQKEYRDALRQFAADGDQYGNCRDVIRRAQAAAAAKKSAGNGNGTAAPGAAPGGGGPSGGAGAIGSAPAAEQLKQASDTERQAVQTARGTEPGSVAVDNAMVDPAAVGTAPGVNQASDLPTPVLLLLALLLAGALAVAGLRVRRLVNARRA
ncbi:MAG: hypothetical protein QOI64_1056 [Solirubrobacteraceae bacterium]|nr:hypothetical protein [Solirubrobacteraceae bacterium]